MQQRKWVFLLGLTRGVGHWGDFIDKFKLKFPMDEFELIDLPGNGLRNKEVSPLQVENYVELVRNKSELVHQGPVHILGSSLGGMVAISWAEQMPDEVASINIMNTSSASLQASYKRFLPSALLTVAKTLKKPLDSQFKEKTTLEVIMNHSERRAQFFSQFSDFSIENPVSFENFTRQVIAASRFKVPTIAPLEKSKICLMTAFNDHLVSSDCTRNIAQLWGCDFHNHPWAGHEIFLDDPEWVLDRI